MTTPTLMEQMKSEGWTFGYRCSAYMGCTMSLHFHDPNDQPHAVKDLEALQRYFGTEDQRITAMDRHQRSAVRDAWE